MNYSPETIKVGRHQELKLMVLNGQEAQILLHKEYGCGTNLL